VDDRSSLLDALRIERPEDENLDGRNWLRWLGVTVVIAGAALAAWFQWGTNDAIAVRVVTVEPVAEGVAIGRGSILDASGYVIARRQATVSSKITGKVIEILIEEGQRVEQDQIVARLDDTNARAAVAQASAQFEQAKATLNAAQVAFDNATRIFRRNEEQFASDIISAQTFDTAKASYDAARASVDVAIQGVHVAEATLALTQRNLEDTIVRAPFAGIVTVKAAQEGEMISPVSAGGGFTRTGIGTIVDMDSLEVEVDVSENFINRVYPDQNVTARLNAYPNWEIPAHVIAIIPTADRAKATVSVRVGLGEKDQRILPQMGVRVAFHEQDTAEAVLGRSEAAFRVPTDAIQVNGDTGVVFVVRDNMVERRAVRLGPQFGEESIVLLGLEAGNRLAIGDFTELADGVEIQIEER